MTPQKGESMSSNVQALVCLQVTGYGGSRLDYFYRVLCDEILVGIAAILDRHSPLNTCCWGDTVLATFERHTVAALCSLDVRDYFRQTNWRKSGLSEPLSARIALHAGPVFHVTELPGLHTMAGPALDLALRLKSFTPPGEVWASEAFASQLRADLVAEQSEEVELHPVASAAELDGREGRTFSLARQHETWRSSAEAALSEINDRLRALAAELGCRSCSLRLLEGPAKKYTYFLSAFGPGAEKLLKLRQPADTGIAGSVIRMCTSRIDNQLGEARNFDPKVARKAGVQPLNMLTVPLFDRNHEVFGVAQLVNKAGDEGEPVGFTRDDLELCERFASEVGPRLSPLAQHQGSEGGPAVQYEGIRECSVIFTDLASYGRLVELLSPLNLHLVPRLLDQYLKEVCRLAQDHNCWVDKFLGDGAMLLTNAPAVQPDFATSAVRFALELSDRVKALLEDWQGFGWDIDFVRSRIGIATGEVFLKTLGGPEVNSYTAVGPASNLGWRLVNLNSGVGHAVVVCSRTHELTVGELTAMRQSSAEKVETKDRPGEVITVHRISL